MGKRSNMSITISEVNGSTAWLVIGENSHSQANFGDAVMRTRARLEICFNSLNTVHWQSGFGLSRGRRGKCVSRLAGIIRLVVSTGLTVKARAAPVIQAHHQPGKTIMRLSGRVR